MPPPIRGGAQIWFQQGDFSFLIGLCDSDWSEDEDDMKSTFGMHLFLAVEHFPRLL